MTEDGKFEVGDRVRCVKHPDPQAYPLEVGTIFTITNMSTAGYLRRIKGSFGECFNQDLFELVQPFGTHKLLKRGRDVCKTDL